MSITVFKLFGLPITGFGLGCVCALVVYMAGTAVWCRILRTGYGVWIRLAALSVPLAWLFARLTYVASDFFGALVSSSYYLGTIGNPLLALRFWDGGYSLMGALFGLMIAARLAEKWTNQRGSGDLLDAVGFAAPLAVLVERGFEYGTGMGIGKEVTYPWLVSTGLCLEADGYFFHPVYLYEAFMALLIYLLLLLWLRRRREHIPGELLRLFLVLFGLTQVVLESLRADEHMVVHFVHVQQVLAICLCTGAMISWTVKAGRKKRKGLCAVLWMTTAIAISAAIIAEFGVDRWGNYLMAYGLMCLGLIVIGICAHFLQMAANRPQRV